MQNVDRNASENSYAQDTELHVDEAIENVRGAGACAQIEVEYEIEHGVGFLRGFQSFFYGRQAKEMIKKFLRLSGKNSTFIKCSHKTT